MGPFGRERYARIIAQERADNTHTEQVVWKSGALFHVLELGEPPLDDDAERIAEIAPSIGDWI